MSALAGFSWRELRLHQAQQILAENLNVPLRALRLDAIDRVQSILPTEAAEALRICLESETPFDLFRSTLKKELEIGLAPKDLEKDAKITEALWLTPRSAPNPFYDELKTIIPGLRAKVRLNLLCELRALLRRKEPTPSFTPLRLPLSLYGLMGRVNSSTLSPQDNGMVLVIGPARLLQTKDSATGPSSERFVALEQQIAKELENRDSKTLTIEDRTNLLVLSSAYVSYSVNDLLHKADSAHRTLSWVFNLEDEQGARLDGLTTAEWSRAVQFLVFWLSKRSWPLLKLYIGSQNPKPSAGSFPRKYRVEGCLSTSSAPNGVAIRMTATAPEESELEPKITTFTLVDTQSYAPPEKLLFTVESDEPLAPLSESTISYFFHRSLEDGHANRAWQEYLSFDRLRHRLQHLRVDDLPNRQALLTSRARELVNADIAVYFYFHSLDAQLKVGSINTAVWIDRSDRSRLEDWLKAISQDPVQRSQSAVYRCLDTRIFQSKLTITEASRPFAVGWTGTVDSLPVDSQVWGIVPADILAVPVQFHDRMLGVLYLASATPGRYRYYDRIRLLSFVRMFEAEIFEARLFRTLKEMNEDLGEGLRATLNQTAFGDRLMRRLGHLLSVSGAVLWWRSPSKNNMLEIVGFAGQRLTTLSHGLEVPLASFGLPRSPSAEGDPVTIALDHNKIAPIREASLPLLHSLCVPLPDLKNSRYLGAITLHDSSPIEVSRFLEDEVRFVRDELRQNLDSFMEHRERLRALRDLIGHEVNSALRHIESIGKRLVPLTHLLPDERRGDYTLRLSDIERNVKRARQLLDVLTKESIRREFLTKRESGFLSLYQHLSQQLTHPVSVPEAINVALHGRARDLRKQLITFNLTGKYPPKLWLAEEAIEEIVANLVDNVVKYGQRKTQMLVGFGEDEVEYFISFESRGMPLRKGLRDNPAEVFRPGVRGIENELARTMPGSGQGLFAAREIAKVWDGNLELHYQHGQPSAVFRLTLSLPRWLGGRSNPWLHR